MCMVFYLYVCLHITFMSGAHGGEKGMSSPLELGLQTVVGHHADAREEQPVLLTTKTSL